MRATPADWTRVGTMASYLSRSGISANPGTASARSATST
ncbi:Uncharacterised protein [Mycobacteroides abscessus subsp. abscessus]|nr:Uncharacterised protein [Mycobacteroides abscessus subsp. abscessus]